MSTYSSTFTEAASSSGTSLVPTLPDARAIAAAKSGLRPVDVTGHVFPSQEVQAFSTKLAQARQARRFYSATSAGYWSPDAVIADDNHGLGSVLVKKLAAWTVGKEVQIRPRRDNADEAEILTNILQSNGGRRFLYRSVLNGLLDGTSYWHPYVRQHDILGRVLPPELHTIGIQRIPFQHCFPIWNPNTEGVMDACLVQFPVSAVAPGGTSIESRLFSRIYTRDRILTYLDYERQAEEVNPLGVVPIIPLAFNNEETVANLGTSTLWPLIPEMKRLSELSASKDNVVHYHAMPTILIMGGDINNAERSSRAIWSFSDPDVKAEMLKLDAAAMEPITQEVKEQILRILQIARVPPIALGPKEIKLTGSTTQGLSIMFGPLLEAASEHQDSMAPGMSRLIMLMSLMMEVYLDIPGATKFNWDVDIIHKSMLPRDEAADFELAMKKRSEGILSKQEMIRQFSQVPDDLRLRQELAADRMEELASVREKAAALNGGSPNMLAPMLASPFIDYDTSKLIGGAEKVLQTSDESVKGASVSDDTE